MPLAANTAALNAAAASACMPGRTCWYTVIVNAGLLWPRRSLTTFTGTLAFSRIEAWVWRRSWRRMRRRSLSRTRRSHDWEKKSGWIGSPSGAREHEAVVVSPAGAHPLLELLTAPRPQHGDGPRVEVDRAPAVRRLHVGDVRAVLDRQDLLVDDEAGGVEVDVAPRQAEHLAASHAGVGGEEDRHVPLAVLDAGEELAQLVG